jgi:hypothetical protein
VLPSTIPLRPTDQTIFAESRVAICPGKELPDNPDEPPRVSNGLHVTKPKKNQIAEQRYQQVWDNGQNIREFWEEVKEK